LETTSRDFLVYEPSQGLCQYSNKDDEQSGFDGKPVPKSNSATPKGFQSPNRLAIYSETVGSGRRRALESEEHVAWLRGM
jgi:hypothetical protein